MRNSTRLTNLAPSLIRLWTLLLLTSIGTPVVVSQQGTLIREKIHGPSLENTVTGESRERDVAVYLPPSYATAVNKRYPVIYLLHGFKGSPYVPAEWGTIEDSMNWGIAQGKFGEMIVVIPDERTKAGGSFYTNSPVSGNWEDFTAKDLVGYIDHKYRTFARASSRGIAGHSMGGYGAIKLGMKYPETYSVVYALSPAILGWASDFSPENPAFAAVLKMKSRDEVFNARDVYPEAIICVAQALSPNPGRPPFYVDFPFEMIEEKLRPAQPAYGKWEENFPLNMIGRYRANLLKLRGLRFDVGSWDKFTHIRITSRALSADLTKLGVQHIFEEYNGDHLNRIWGRRGRLYTEVLPYFWRLLESK